MKSRNHATQDELLALLVRLSQVHLSKEMQYLFSDMMVRLDIAIIEFDVKGETKFAFRRGGFGNDKHFSLEVTTERLFVLFSDYLRRFHLIPMSQTFFDESYGPVVYAPEPTMRNIIALEKLVAQMKEGKRVAVVTPNATTVKIVTDIEDFTPRYRAVIGFEEVSEFNQEDYEEMVRHIRENKELYE